MREVFADSFHFLALLNADDPAHERAVSAHSQRGRALILTDCVLLELGDALCNPKDHADFLALHQSLVFQPSRENHPAHACTP